jgi:signal transduction histidine kinase
VRVRAKVSLAIGCSVLLSGAAIYYFAAEFLMRSFLTLESDAVARNVRRAHDALEESEKRLDEKLSDWAAWDATCEYVADSNDKFRDENLLPESYRRLGVSIIAILDPNSKVVWAKELPAGADAFADVSPELLKELRTGMPLTSHESPDSHVTGFLSLQNGLLQAASRPILSSSGEGPSHGTLVFATWIGPERIQHFAQLTHLELDIREGQWTAGSERVGETAIGRATPETVTGSTTIPDLHGRPVSITIRMPREVYGQGRRTIAQLLLLMSCQVVFLSGLVLVMLRRTVLNRLESLADQADRIHDGHETAGSIWLPGNDELSKLAGALRGMIEKLERSREAAEDSSRAKSAFLANVTHEIRTPMTAVMGFADLLADPDASPKDRQEFAQRIREGGDHLLALINDLLDTSKIEAGAMTVERLPVNPATILEEAAGLVRHRTDTKGLSLELLAATALPRTIHTDPTRLKQVLLNLLGNAVKFTEHGSVRIEAACVAGSHPALEIRVRDTGVGIAPASLSKLFRPFTQADASVTRKYGGTGLGLAISRNLVELMGGRLEVASVLGVGSTFTVVLPITAAEAADCAEFKPVVPAPANPRNLPTATDFPVNTGEGCLTGRRVLLVEDGPDNQRLVTHLLRRAGADVVVAENGRRGLEAYSNNGPFDLVLMDMQMPEMDGYAAARELRRRGERVPVIAFSAHTVADEREKCIEAGCDDQIPKPIAREALVKACVAWTSRARAA